MSFVNFIKKTRVRNLDAALGLNQNSRLFSKTSQKITVNFKGLNGKLNTLICDKRQRYFHHILNLRFGSVRMIGVP